MKNILLSFLVLSFSLTSFAQKIVGYIPQYRTIEWMDDHIEWDAMTDAYYFGARVGNAQGTAITIEQPTRFTHVRSKAAQNDLSLWLSIGGWNKSEYYSNVAANATARTNFANEMVKLCSTYNLTGVDLDWEFPQSYDKANYKLLLKAISDAFDADGSGYLLSVAVGAEQGHANNWDSGSFQYIDKLNIMTYDDPKLTDGNHASLKFMKAAMEIYKTAGCPYEKMLGGVAFYSRCSSVQMYNQFASASTYNTDLSGGKCYNGKQTNDAKLDWVMSKGGQGVLIWEITQDVKGQYSLLKALKAKADTYSPCSVDEPKFSSLEVSICGKNSIVLNPNITQQSGVTYSWKKDGQTINGSGITYSATSQGNYEVIAKNTECEKKATIAVVGTIAPVSLVEDINLCETVNEVIDAGTIDGNIKWYKDGQILSETSASLNVGEAGIYKIEVSATNCQSVSDEVTVTSDLVTAEDITICDNAEGTLIVNESVAGIVSWYSSASSTTALSTGEQFQVSTSSTTTYYVGVAGSAGTSCAGVEEWSASSDYAPATASGSEIYVIYNNNRYSLKAGIWWTKGNDPEAFTNLWKLEGACGAASCTKTSATVTVDACLSSEETIAFVDYKVFPNPVSDVVNVLHKEEVLRIDVISSIGTTVLTTTSTSVDVDGIPQGNYILKITTSKGTDYSKIIKD